MDLFSVSEEECERTHFYQKLRLCSCGTKPQHSGNHWCLQLCDESA